MQKITNKQYVSISRIKLDDMILIMDYAIESSTPPKDSQDFPLAQQEQMRDIKSQAIDNMTQVWNRKAFDVYLDSVINMADSLCSVCFRQTLQYFESFYFSSVFTLFLSVK